MGIHSLRQGCSKPTISRQIMDIADEFSLHQLVSEPTRKDNIFDLFFISNPTHIDQVMLVPAERKRGE